MSDRVYLTRDGYNRLKEELYDLLHVTRPEVLEKIAEARSHGDLSEKCRVRRRTGAAVADRGAHFRP